MEVHPLTQSLDVKRYRQFAMGENPDSNTQSHESVFKIKKSEKDIDLLASGAYGRTLIPKKVDKENKLKILEKSGSTSELKPSGSNIISSKGACEKLMYTSR